MIGVAVESSRVAAVDQAAALCATGVALMEVYALE